MELRVDELAEQAEASVDTIRFYQAKGLLPPPRREGRIAWYGQEHIERLARIRSLKGRGLSLATIGLLLRGELDAADEALIAAVAGAAATGDTEEPISRDELAERSGIPGSLLDEIVRRGLLMPRRTLGGDSEFTTADVEVVAAGLRLLEHGLPLHDLLDLATRHDAAMREVAERAVELFDVHVRQTLRSSGLPDEEAAARLVDAFTSLLPATEAVVAHHFRRMLLSVATEHIESVGAEAELLAVREAAGV